MHRRIFDIVLSIGGLLVLAPLFLLIALAVKLESSGSVFFKGARSGQNGVPFKLWKFRTMVTGAERMGPGITAAGDVRVTRVGRLLRRSKLDELPQLINVLRGDMTFVGPRPEDPRFVREHPEIYAPVLHLKPGITGAGSLLFRDEEAILAGEDWEKMYFHEVLPQKLRADAEYASRQTLCSDLSMMVRTVIKCLN